jgi:hypothetical protein
MFRVIRRSILALAAASVLAASGAQASSDFVGQDEHASDSAGPMVDLFVLRPLGLVATVLGAGLMAPAAVLMTVTGQPHHMDVPYQWLLASPIQFTFVDPIGTH